MLALIETYVPEQHGAPVYAIWKQMLGDTWPLSQAMFDTVTCQNDGYQAGDHLVAVSGHEVIGFVATQTAPDKRSGEIMLIMVRQDFQRQGVGMTLLQAAVARLTANGCREVQLGCGGIAYFWPGVPTNLPQAIRFFEHNGWEYGETSVDMVGDLYSYRTPDAVYQRIAPLGITFQIVNPTTAPQVLAFENEHFPRWAASCQHLMDDGNYQDVLYATDPAGAVIGTVLTFSPQSQNSDNANLWQALLGTTMGGFGALGVAEAVRDQGIGLALTAYASEVLKARGVERCFVGWVWSVDWYAKLGFEVWRSYRMSRRDLT